MNLYLCTGEDPSKQSNFPPKVNIPMVGTMVVSVLLQTAVQIKILHSKRKTNSEQISNTPNLNLHFYETFLHHSLSDFATNIFGVSIAIGAISLVSIINKFSPAEINIYPNYYYVYALQMYLPMVFGSFISLSYYSRNKPMRVLIIKEVREKLSSYGLFQTSF